MTGSSGRPRITVIGIGQSPLGRRAETSLAAASLIVAARRHLTAASLTPPTRSAPGPEGGAPEAAALGPEGGAPEAAAPGLPRPGGTTSRPRIVELSGDLEPALAALAAAGGPSVVLASGDPGFFGVVRALAERFGRHRLEVLPSVSSVAAAFAAAGLPWDDALVVSAHGRDPNPVVHTCLGHPKVAVLTQPGFGPAELAARLTGSGRRMLVAERLGEPDERVVEGAPATIAAGRWADPNVVLVLDEGRAVPAGKSAAWPAHRGPARWALPEDAFVHRDGMITKAEVRALALARLGPGIGDLVWDVGAGSGSVGVECARLGAAVIAIDRDPLACKLVAANAERHGVAVQVVDGTAPEALVALPDPDAVFVGGGGGALEAVLRPVTARTGRAVVVALTGAHGHSRPERVLLAARSLAAAGMEVETVRLRASRFPTSTDLRASLATNPVYLVSGTRP